MISKLPFTPISYNKTPNFKGEIIIKKGDLNYGDKKMLETKLEPSFKEDLADASCTDDNEFKISFKKKGEEQEAAILDHLLKQRINFKFESDFNK